MKAHFIMQLISYTWIGILCGYTIAAKVSGVGAIGKILIKLVSILTLVYLLLDVLQIKY